MRACRLTALAFVLALSAADTRSQGDVLRLKNGDAIGGRLRSGDGKQVRWSSPHFQGDLTIKTESVATINFAKGEQAEAAPFRIVTTSGDVFHADVAAADEKELVLQSARHGRVRVPREAIHSIDRRGQQGVAFDGSMFRAFRVAQSGPIQNLRYRMYRGGWDLQKLPDFEKLTPVAEGHYTGGRFDMELVPVHTYYALVFEGQIEVPQSGRYSFSVRGDDLARLCVDGKQIAKSRLTSRLATVDLTAGHHAVRLEYMQNRGSEALTCFVSGPGMESVNLVGVNKRVGWRRGASGQAYTDKKEASLFAAVELPERFELSLVLSSSQSPRFCLGLGKGAAGVVASEQPVRFESWGDGLMFVAGEVFEPIAKLPDDQRELRLRLVFDTKTRVLEVFDSNTKRKRIHGVSLASGASGVYLHNRGADLTVQGMRIQRTSTGSAERTAEFVRLVDGTVIPGGLRIDATGARVVKAGKATAIELAKLGSVVRPTSALEAATPDGVELRYQDGAVLRGTLESVGAQSLSLRTAFAELSVLCDLAAAAQLRFGVSEEQKLTAVDDEVLLASGHVRGRLSFVATSPGATDTPIRFTMPGATAVRLAPSADARVERSLDRVSRGPSFDTAKFPHVLHLKNGEVLPCRVEAFDRKVVRIRSAFGPGRQIDARHLKSIEFTGTSLGPRDEEPAFRKTTLDRALTVPRFRRDDPPSHVVVATNGDMLRGVVLGIANGNVQFESKLKKRDLSIDRVAWIVDVSASSGKAASTPDGTVRVELEDGPIVLCVPHGVKDGRLLARSSLHGDVALPIANIRNLDLGDRALSPRLLYDTWTVRPAPEPTWAAKPKPPPASDNSKKK